LFQDKETHLLNRDFPELTLFVVKLLPPPIEPEWLYELNEGTTADLLKMVFWNISRRRFTQLCFASMVGA
jgi:hypothetical protein